MLAQNVEVALPYFTSSGNTYRAQVGNSVTLICQVDNLGKFLNTKIQF